MSSGFGVEESKLARASARRSGGLCERQVTPQTALSLGQPQTALSLGQPRPASASLGQPWPASAIFGQPWPIGRVRRAGRAGRPKQFSPCFRRRLRGRRLRGEPGRQARACALGPGLRRRRGAFGGWHARARARAGARSQVQPRHELGRRRLLCAWTGSAPPDWSARGIRLRRGRRPTRSA